jgi:hypothetical protein
MSTNPRGHCLPPPVPHFFQHICLCHQCRGIVSVQVNNDDLAIVSASSKQCLWGSCTVMAVVQQQRFRSQAGTRHRGCDGPRRPERFKNGTCIP